MTGSGAVPGRAGWRDTLLIATLALLARGLTLLVCGVSFPPVDDGVFYQVVADRIARGLGYTWLWPDGAVTYAAHYPVGYPALMGALYALFGSRPVVAMALNAAIGVFAAAGAHRLAALNFTRRAALISGCVAALAPELLFYTPAVMTEAVSGSLLVIAAALATLPRPERPVLRAVLGGALMGIAALIRPELLLLAPVIGALAVAGDASVRQRLFPALAALCMALALCVPWTLRNCAKLDGCTLVSANGGWNLYIGASPVGRGGFAPLDQIGVPDACREVFGEVEKDRCFGRAGAAVIAADPAAWLSLVPAKLRTTFEYGTAATYYLSVSNPTLVDERAKLVLGGIELAGQRLVLLFALVALSFGPGPRKEARRVVGFGSFVLALSPGHAVAAWLPPAWPAYVGLIALGPLLGRRLFVEPAALVAVSAVAMTALVHAVFFGASRYALVAAPALAALAGGGIDAFAALVCRSFDKLRKKAG